MDSIWWNHVAGPASYVRCIHEALTLGNHLVLLTPSDIPYRGSLRSHVEQRYNQSWDTVPFDILDYTEDLGGKDSMEMQLLERFSPEAWQNYRPVHDVYRYLAKKAVFENRIVWIKGIDEKGMQPCLQFLQKYLAAAGSEPSLAGQFILEFRYKPALPQLPSSVSILDYRDATSEFDMFLYVSLSIGELHVPDKWKKYLIYLISALAEPDAELAWQMLNVPDMLNKDPLAVLDLCAKASMETSGYQYSKLSLSHPFNLLQKNRNELEYRMWKAQMQSLFHLIEEERLDFIHRHEALLKSMLPIEDDYEKTINHPYFLEFRHIRFLLYQHALYLPKPEYDRLLFLHEMRNSLAHLIPLSVNEVTRLLS